MNIPLAPQITSAADPTIRTGLSEAEISQAFQDNLCCGLGRLERGATPHDLYVALALTVRDRLFKQNVASLQSYGGISTLAGIPKRSLFTGRLSSVSAKVVANNREKPSSNRSAPVPCAPLGRPPVGSCTLTTMCHKSSFCPGW